MIKVNAFVGRIVTPRLAIKTHCHDNFGYYLRKHLIPRPVESNRTGVRYAGQSKLVYR